MSYSCTIYFKNIKADEVYSFFQKIKKRVISKTDEIAKDNFLWLPSIRNSHRFKDIDEFIDDEINKSWVQNSLFKYRYFYIPQHELLGVFSLPDGFDDMFDNVSYFQNSCDQDYEFDEWKGVPIFEQIAEKWKNQTDEMVQAYYSVRWGEYDDDDLDCDYHRRSFAYDEIWKMFEDYLYKDEICVYLSLFGGYESWRLGAIVEKCKQYYKEWQEECEQKRGNNNAED